MSNLQWPPLTLEPRPRRLGVGVRLSIRFRILPRESRPLFLRRGSDFGITGCCARAHPAPVALLTCSRLPDSVRLGVVLLGLLLEVLAEVVLATLELFLRIP
jgi:hypothetical protein